MNFPCSGLGSDYSSVSSTISTSDAPVCLLQTANASFMCNSTNETLKQFRRACKQWVLAEIELLSHAVLLKYNLRQCAKKEKSGTHNKID